MSSFTHSLNLNVPREYGYHILENCRPAFLYYR